MQWHPYEEAPAEVKDIFDKYHLRLGESLNQVATLSTGMLALVRFSQEPKPVWFMLINRPE